MRHTDVLIVGGGLAGSLAGAMLGRKRLAAILVDPHEVYPPELRCEKLDGRQIAILMRTGIGDAVLPHTALACDLDVVRFDRVLDRKPGLQRGIMYDGLVNAVRAAIPASVGRIKGKVNAIANSADRQTVTLSSGEEISARLVVLANGLNVRLRESLGMTKDVISTAHSITIGFDVKPAGSTGFGFEALTYYPCRLADRFAYLTLFPVPGAMRANFMVYREITDPWLASMRKSPKEALLEAIPRLEQVIGPFEITNQVWIRPADLYQTTGADKPGVVLVGDAYASSCPAAGTGTGKVFTDVERLCNRYIPDWLATDGMPEEKIAAFYADPEKIACDSFSRNRAFSLKAAAIDPSPRWMLIRWSKFLLRWGIGMARRFRGPLTAPSLPEAETQTHS